MICCVTGHRPQGFPFPYDSENERMEWYELILYHELEKLVKKGYTHFISGMAQGADLDFANAVSLLKVEYEVTLEAAIPYSNQAKSWPEEAFFRYLDLLDECDVKTVLSETFYRGCLQVRNRYMVDHSDLVLAIWNGTKKGGTWNTICYAQKIGKPIQYIMLNDLKFDYSSL